MIRAAVSIVVDTGPPAGDVARHLSSLGREPLVVQDAGDGLRAALESGAQVVLTPADQLTAVRATLDLGDAERQPPAVLALAAGGGPGASGPAVGDPLLEPLDWPAARDDLWPRVERLCEQWVEREELRLRRACACTLHDIAETLAASVEFEDLLHDVLVRLLDGCGAERTVVLVTSTSDSLLYLLGSSDDPTACRLPVERDNHPEVEEVLTQGQEMYVEEAGGALPGSEVFREALRRRRIGALWAVPLRWRGEAFGVLEVCFASSVRLEEPTSQLVRQAAALIGPILRNSELFASLREQTRKRVAAEIEPGRQDKMLQKYDDFFNRSFDGILVLDRDHRIIHINPAGEQITGYARHGLVGTRLTELVDARDREMLDAFLRQMGPTSSAQSFDLGLTTTSGDPILVSVSPNAVFDEDEVLVLGFRDVTEARSLENELRSTKEFLERLIDSTVDSILATDIDGRIILFNKGAERLFVMQGGDVVGKLYLEDLYPPGVAAKVMEQLRSPEAGGIGRLTNVRKEILNDNQERVPISLSASLIYEGGQEVGTVAILSDLRERLRIEHRLAQAQEKLIANEKQSLIAELAGTTAHELNQPLTSVMGYAELLKRRMEGGSEANTRAVDTIIREAERMAEIVRKIGKITRYETKTYVGETQILDLERSTDE